jgi:hypothetical protein
LLLDHVKRMLRYTSQIFGIFWCPMRMTKIL